MVGRMRVVGNDTGVGRGRKIKRSEAQALDDATLAAAGAFGMDGW